MNSEQCRLVSFKFHLSDWTLFRVSLPLQVRSERLIDETPPVEVLKPPNDALIDGSQGFLIRGLPVAAKLPSISLTGDYLCYVPLRYVHYYIDFHQPFETYQKKFSSKTRSTIQRKIKKYEKHCGGYIPWKTYKSQSEMRDFFRLARAVSKKTYQERLLNAGIPDSEDFILQAESLAAEQRLRAYILFDGEKPVSYLYCPVQDDVLIYAYLGYDPDYMHLSVGTILQWLAIEQMFSEARFRYFDFTEGESEHKRLFATHQRRCANVYMIKRSPRNTAVVLGHLFMERFSKCIGTALDRLGLKAKIKRWIRFKMIHA